MKIAVLSDIHDHLDRLDAALAQVAVEKPAHLLFLGDFCAPFSLARLAEGFSGPIDCVFGNNDGDQFLLCSIAAKFQNVKLHGHLAELHLGGRHIAINHYPDIAKRLAESGAYDAVFSGHDHKHYVHEIGASKKTLWANPGEIMGRYGHPTWGLYDTESNVLTHVSISDS